MSPVDECGGRNAGSPCVQQCVAQLKGALVHGDPVCVAVIVYGPVIGRYEVAAIVTAEAGSLQDELGQDLILERLPACKSTSSQSLLMPSGSSEITRVHASILC